MHWVQPENEKQWEAWADALAAPLQQRWLYGAAGERLGRKTTRVALIKNDAPIGLAQTLSRKVLGLTISLTSRGLLPDGQTQKQARRDLKPHLPMGLRLMTPDHPIAGLPLSPAQIIATLDLSPARDELRANLHQKWRNALKKAESSNVKTARLSPSRSSLMPLLSAEKQRQSNGAYQGLPPEFALVLLEVAPKSLYLLSALDAQVLFVGHGNTATYLIGHIGPEARAAGLGNLLMWRAMTSLQDAGVAKLDLGTVDTAKAPDLARFKLRTGAQAKKIGKTVFL